MGCLFFCCGLVVLHVCGSVLLFFKFYVSFSSFKTLWLHGNYINILGNNSEEPCEAVSNFLDKLGG